MKSFLSPAKQLPLSCSVQKKSEVFCFKTSLCTSPGLAVPSPPSHFVLLSPTVHPWYLVWVWLPALLCGVRSWTVLVDAEGEELRVPVEHIETRQPSTLSLMPENLVETLKQADLNDLLAFLLAQSTFPAAP